MGVDDPVWVPTVFTKNRDRLLNKDIACKFPAAMLSDKAVAPLLSNEHFSVDGTLIEAWASIAMLFMLVADLRLTMRAAIGRAAANLEDLKRRPATRAMAALLAFGQ